MHQNAARLRNIVSESKHNLELSTSLIESCRSCLCLTAAVFQSVSCRCVCADVLERLQQHPSGHGAAFEMQLPPNARRAAPPLVSHVIQRPSSDGTLCQMTCIVFCRSAGPWLDVHHVRCCVLRFKLGGKCSWQRESSQLKLSRQKAVFPQIIKFLFLIQSILIIIISSGNEYFQVTSQTSSSHQLENHSLLWL